MRQAKVLLGNKAVGEGCPPYIIAEAGSNFNQDLDTARRLVDVAVEAGANAIKFQLFSADKLYPGGGGLHSIFREIELNPDWVPLLSEHARSCGITFMASAFDRGSLDTLEEVDVPAHKVASSETADLPFLHYVATKGRPIIVSTGMCDMVDVEEAVNVCAGVGNNQLVLMQCGAMYPLPVALANLRVIPVFVRRFGCPVGFSDHTLGNAAALVAVGLGASVFEKHITLDRSARGPDHFYAVEPAELKTYVNLLHEGYQALGSQVKEMLPDERLQGRREGLYAADFIPAGSTIGSNDVVLSRPAKGLRARYRTVLWGARVTRDIEAGEPLNWSDVAFDSNA